MVKQIKEKSLSKIFILYIISFILVTLMIPISAIVLLFVTIDNGIILPANYYEQIVETNRIKISSAPISDIDSLIPDECKYAVFDLNGNSIISNVDKEETSELWDLIENDNTNKGNYYFKVISRNNEVCIVGYTLREFFKNVYLRKIFPNPDLLLIIVSLISFIIEIIILSRRFAKRISKELNILMNATNNITMANLDFSIGNSNIKEINDVLNALSKMKKELSISLHKIWKTDEQKKSQIGSLAHDIKTPLTIIKGNAELLDELNLTKEQSLFIDRILKETNTIENYTKSLIEIMNSEKDFIINKEKINTKDFLNEIIDTSHFLCSKKHIKLVCTIKISPQYINVDKVYLKRSIINIITNAIDYSPPNDRLYLTIEQLNYYLNIIVEDNGKGFSREELNNAKNQFFQGDKSRSSKNHYGMGLYIADTLIKKHNGFLLLENSSNYKGAKVIIQLPIINEL